MIQVEIANEQSKHAFNSDFLRQAVRTVLAGESLERAEISVAIVDDAAIHGLNLKYLQHDYATDVLSFLLNSPGEPLEGEIVLSAETAAREASQYGWNKEDELLLYLIHGTLHLIGHDDTSDAERAAMRAKERRYLAELGRHPRYDEREPAPCDSRAVGRPGEGETRS